GPGLLPIARDLRAARGARAPGGVLRRAVPGRVPFPAEDGGDRGLARRGALARDRLLRLSGAPEPRPHFALDLVDQRLASTDRPPGHPGQQSCLLTQAERPSPDRPEVADVVSPVVELGPALLAGDHVGHLLVQRAQPAEGLAVHPPVEEALIQLMEAAV